jgi:hypothetical protein
MLAALSGPRAHSLARQRQREDQERAGSSSPGVADSRRFDIPTVQKLVLLLLNCVNHLIGAVRSHHCCVQGGTRPCAASIES